MTNLDHLRATMHAKAAELGIGHSIDLSTKKPRHGY